MAGGYISLPRYTEYVGGGEHEITSYCVKHARMMNCGYEGKMDQVMECMMRNRIRGNSNADEDVQRHILEQFSSLSSTTTTTATSTTSSSPIIISPLTHVCNVCGEGYICSPLGMEFTIKHHDLKYPSGYSITLREQGGKENTEIDGIFGIAIIDI